MDKSCVHCSKMSSEYEDGVEEFMKFVVGNFEGSSVIKCPCTKCMNLSFRTHKVVREHFYFHGFDVSYTTWSWHREDVNDTPLPNVDVDVPFEFIDYNDCNIVDMVDDAYRDCAVNPKAFKELLEQAEKPLYPGCTNFTKLGTLVSLFNIKGKFGWSDTSFTELLSLLAKLPPESNEILVSMYEAKKTMSALGLEYPKIHACPNDCILYRKEYEGLFDCPSCGLFRWEKKDGSVDQYRKGVLAKVLWYFSSIPRFKCMFQSSETVKDLTWHANERVDDGKLRHSVDSPSWKLIDNKWPTFALDPRNLHLALAANGINPHSSLSSTYSCWPIILIRYNLPPWLCMKKKFMMLSLLISAPQQPSNDIDVYLAPLIEDIQNLWAVGVDAYDAYRKELFNLQVVLFWTINDFQAYGNLAGCTVKGYNACPYCGVDTTKCKLKHSGKMHISVTVIGFLMVMNFETKRKPMTTQ